MKLIALSAIWLFATAAFAQTTPAANGIAGKFYVSVDDGARIFVNGELVHNANVGTSASRETTLKPGDRIVAQLHEAGGGKRFKVLFLSSDQKTMVAFTRQAFHILGDRAVVDFTPVDWAKASKYAKPSGSGDDGFPIKTTADWIWGEDNDCAIGANVTAEMFKNPPAAAAARPDALPIVLTVEGLVDGPSTLYVRKDGVSWSNGNNAKPGLLREPTYVNGTAWMPKWGLPAQERGFDRSDVSPLTLITLDLAVELASNSPERGADIVDPSRSRIEIKKRTKEIEIIIPDPQPGARWHKIVFRIRKR